VTNLAIEAHGLVKRFGDAVAVAGIDLKVAANTYCCLLGPSGCGKSSTLRMIAGHEEPTSGHVVLGAREITHLSPAQRGTAMMFQSYALFPHLTVLGNVAFSAQMKGVARVEREAKAMELLKLVAMEPYAQRLPAALSGGQQQRVALARALMTQPRVLLLDEPLAGMGAEETDRMLTLLTRLKATHAILLVEHDMDAVFRIADRITVMVNGTVIATGDPKSIRENPEVRTAYLGEDH